MLPSLLPGIWNGPAAPDSPAGHQDGCGAAEVSAASEARSPHHRWPEVFQISSKEKEHKEQGLDRQSVLCRQGLFTDCSSLFVVAMNWKVLTGRYKCLEVISHDRVSPFSPY